jgi:hypothetical protein
MYKTRLALAGLLLGSPLLSLAQDAEPAPYPRYYVGLSVYSGPYHYLGFPNIDGTKFRIPIQATFGYQLRPRLAVQLGLVYSGYKDNFGYGYDYTDMNAYKVHYEGNSTLTRRNYSTSLLMRYTLTHKPAHHFQFDLVGGLILIQQRLHITTNETYSYVDYPQSPSTNVAYDNSDPFHSLNVNVGPSFRYRFGQRFEAVGDILFFLPLTNDYLRLDASTALGLRYRFGQ